MKDIELNTVYTEELLVTEGMLACKVGSGEVAVFATPMMIAAMEHAAMKCVEPYLEGGETSVGVMMHATHDAATPCDMKVTVSAQIVAVDRKKIHFSITARDECGPIGSAAHDRCIVNKEKFELRAKNKRVDKTAL